MTLSSTILRRIAVYSFYDRDGIVDDYIPVFLQALACCVQEIVFVTNGSLTPESQTLLAPHVSHIVYRDGTPCPLCDYAMGLSFLGIEKQLEADEIILCSDALMGPVHPLADTLDHMAHKDLDFWAMTYSYTDSASDTPTRTLSTHFFVMRRSLLQSKTCAAFWSGLSPCDNPSPAGAPCRYDPASYFAKNGFCGDAAVDTETLATLTATPLLHLPRIMMEEKNCPVFFRDSFEVDFSVLIDDGLGCAAADLFAYLQTNTTYNTDLIVSRLLRVCHLCDVVSMLNLYHVLGGAMRSRLQMPPHRVCLVMHLYFPDLFAYSFSYARHMPDGTDAYITTNSPEKAQQIQSIFSAKKWGKLEVRVIENRGRDVAALLTGVKDVIGSYDLCCFAHDKKSQGARPALLGYSFAEHCLRNTLASDAFCRDVIDLFDATPRLGLLIPAVPNHAIWYNLAGDEWALDYENTAALVQKLGLHVPIAPDKAPVAPMGSMFWFRPQALEPLYAQDWTHADFPPEPLPMDGTISHAIERIHPYVAQHCGFYTAYVLDHTMSRAYLATQAYGAAAVNRTMLGHGMQHTVRLHVMTATLRGGLYPNLQRAALMQAFRCLLPARLCHWLGRIKRRILQCRRHS